ncbi:galactose-specific lectin nattectin [Procambarus clarkii]|uniref:galactose-specific lectin nattectin n=1 Tax=Procambarus clarkii TaxID=6728 RepID=UPI0037425111
MIDTRKCSPQEEDTGTVECERPYVLVGRRCLLLAPGEKLTWAAARQYCVGHGGDLAIIYDANDFAAILHYINLITGARTHENVWVGGSDETVEGVWIWNNGLLMPMGPPFWGYTNNYTSEPGGERRQNCAVIFAKDLYLHDIECTEKEAPLCQLKTRDSNVNTLQ